MAEKIKDETYSLGHSFSNLKPTAVLKKEQTTVLLRKKCIRLKYENEELRSSLKQATDTAASHVKKINALQAVNKQQESKINELTEKIRSKDQEIFVFKKKVEAIIENSEKDTKKIFQELKTSVGKIEVPLISTHDKNDDKNVIEVVEIVESPKSQENIALRVENKKPKDNNLSFKCPFPGCDKFFSRKYNLFLHERTHSQFKPAKCNIAGCNKTFAHPSNLTRHIKTHKL